MSKRTSKRTAILGIVGAAFLTAGVVLAVLWLGHREDPTEMQDQQTSVTTQKQDNQTTDPVATDPTVTTGEPEITFPKTEPTAPTQFSTKQPDDLQTQTTAPEQTVSPEQQLVCKHYSLYSGAFVEDGSDEPVQNVAALLVTNGSEQYLDLATLTYELDGQEAVFVVTGLPAGGSAWVLEHSRKTATADTRFVHKSTVASFRSSAVNTLEGIELAFNGTMLKATNTGNLTVKDLTVYYKVLHEDGNYLGGITYMTTFGDLEPEHSAEKIAGHFRPDKTHIVRIGYRE